MRLLAGCFFRRLIFPPVYLRMLQVNQKVFLIKSWKRSQILLTSPSKERLFYWVQATKLSQKRERKRPISLSLPNPHRIEKAVMKKNSGT
jgi:transcriptional regulator of acetoin/glycerol metabolism